MQERFFFGTSGLVLPFAKSQYPPEHREKSRLEYYATLFNSLEINSTFYKLPRPATVTKWAASVPEHFRFTCKLPKIVTHAKDLHFKREDVNHFLDVVAHLQNKKGCLLAQFPPGLPYQHTDRLKALLDLLCEQTADSGWKLAVEFRHSEWYEAGMEQFLKQYPLSIVIHDMSPSATPYKFAGGGMTYFRFHGPEPGYRGSYPFESLQKYAALIRERLRQNQSVFAYFNNTIGAAFENLQTLNAYVREQADLPLHP